MSLPLPSPANNWHRDFIAQVAAAFARVTGGDLVTEAGLDPAALYSADLGRSVWDGAFALLTHDRNAILSYGNRFALGLWETDWETLTVTPSRLTAPEEDRAARAEIMAAVERDGFTRAYTGRRVSRSGRLFLIENATVFTLTDEKGAGFGTGAFFKSVTRL
jgi:hypothetical protein